MISNKTFITLTLIILGIKYVASTSPRPKKRMKIAAPFLQDMNNQETDVPAPGETPMQVDQVGEQSVSVINEHFKRPIGKRRYIKIKKLAKTMSKDKLIAQICPVVKPYDQYRELKSCFKHHEMVEHFYVYGDMTAVKDAIIIGNLFYVSDQPKEFQKAIGLALERDKHERVCQLLKAIQDGTAERGKNHVKGLMTSFEIFMDDLIPVLAPWKNIKPLARFITFYGKEFNDKYPDIHSIFCERLVQATYDHCSPRYPNDNEGARKLLSDLIGQPSLLTALTFSGGFLYNRSVFYKIGFIEYGWQDAIKEGLKEEYWGGGEFLWDYLKEKYPEQCSGNWPPPEEAIDAVLKLFPTKQGREGAWNKEHTLILIKKLENLNIDHLFPTVLWTIILEYRAFSWSDVC